MKANEQGLTLEERIMFAVLGIILVIAIGVLAFNNFSKQERKAEGTNTVEKERDKEETDKENDVPSKNSLKETTYDNSKVTYMGLPEVTKTKNKFSKSKKTTSKSQTSNKEVEDDNMGTGSTDSDIIIDEGEVDDGAVIKEGEEELLDWTFNSNIVKESYANEIIVIPNTVKLSDDTYKEAEVTIKEKETGKEILIEGNEVSLPAGEYIYVYKCNGKTKELPLTIYSRYENMDITILNEKELLDNSQTDLIYSLNHSKISNNRNDYKLEINRINNYNKIYLKVSLKETISRISTSQKHLELSNSKEYFNLGKDEFVIIVDLEGISLTKTNKFFINIDGTDYLYNFDISINNDQVEEKTEDEEVKNEEVPKEEDVPKDDSSTEEKQEESSIKDDSNNTIDEEESSKESTVDKTVEEEKDSTEDESDNEKVEESEDDKEKIVESEENKEVEKDPEPTPEPPALEESTDESNEQASNTPNPVENTEVLETTDISQTT